MLDLYERETDESLARAPRSAVPEVGVFDGFIRGTALGTVRQLAVRGFATPLQQIGAIGAIAYDRTVDNWYGTNSIADGTSAQDRYFKATDEWIQSAADRWTPKPYEVGIAGEIAGTLLGLLPLAIVSPPTAVAGLQLDTARELATKGVDDWRAQAVGAAQAAGFGVGIWMPFLGSNLWQRMAVGGAGANVLQGVVMRGAAEEILRGHPAAEAFKALDPTEITLDVILGLAFGAAAHYIPSWRAQSNEASQRFRIWAQNITPQELAAIATLRQAQHSNQDSLPGKPMAPADLEAHVTRLKAALDQLERGADRVEVQGIGRPVEDAPSTPAEALDAAPVPEDVPAPARAVEAQDAAAAAVAETRETGPSFEPDPARLQEMARRAAELVAEAGRIRTEERLRVELPTDPAPVPAADRSPFLPEGVDLMAHPQQARRIAEAIEARLREVGDPPERARANAAIWEARMRTRAERYGQSPAEWMRSLGLEIERGDTARPGAMEQKPRLTVTPEGPVLESDSINLREPWGAPKDQGTDVLHEHQVYDRAGKPLGTVALGWRGDQVTQLLNIDAVPQRSGMGERVLRMLLAHNRPETEIFVRHIQPEAVEFWRKMGVRFDQEGTDGILTRELYEQARSKIDPDERADPADQGPAGELPRQDAAGDRRDPGEVEGPRDPAGPRTLEQRPGPRWVSELSRQIEAAKMTQAPAKGQITFADNRTIIDLFETADASTFQHETGRLFLQDIRDIAMGQNAPRQALEDWGVLANWLGNEGGDITRAQHEQFARGWERYLAEGIAPSVELRSVFAQFKEWLLNIYRKLRGLEVELSPEVKNLFDQMLATDAELARTEPDGPPAQRADTVEPPPPPGEAGAEAGPARPEGSKEAGMTMKQLREATKAGPFNLRRTEAKAEIERREKAGEAAFGREVSEMTDAQLKKVVDGGRKFRKSLKDQALAEMKVRADKEAAMTQDLTDPTMRAELERMGAEAGWAQVGGKLADQNMRGKVSISKWIPRADWWTRRPDDMNEADTKEAVRKALAGEPLRAAERRMAVFLLDEAKATLAHYQAVPETEARAIEADWATLAPEAPATTRDVVDADLVAAASDLAEGRVERAAQMHENDDAAFMAEIRSILDEHAQDQATPRGGEEGQRAPEDEANALIHAYDRAQREADLAGDRDEGEPDRPLSAQPDPGTAGEGKATSPLQAAAQDVVAQDPKRLIRVGTTPEGEPMLLTIEEYLQGELADARAAREEIALMDAAATCLLGRT